MTDHTRSESYGGEGCITVEVHRIRTMFRADVKLADSTDHRPR